MRVTSPRTESLHYLDSTGQPLNVRGWYRFWVLTFLAVAGWLLLAVIGASRLSGFDAGAREGGAATSLALALVYAVAWVQDVRHRNAERSFWVRRNRQTARRMFVAGVVGTAGALFGVVAATRAGNSYVAGLLVAPGAAALFCLTLAAEVRRKQRSRGE